MRKIGEHAEAYKEVIVSLQQMREQQASQPEISDTFDEAITQASFILEILDESAGSDFADVITGPVDEHEGERTAIEAVRDTPIYQRGGQVADTLEQGIQEKLAQLPPKPEGYSEEDQTIAQAFFVSRAFRFLFAGITSGKQTNAHESAPANGETDKTTLHITLYKGDNVLMINGEKAIPLSRIVGNAMNDAKEEELIESYRFKALQYIAEHRGEEIISSKIWEAIDTTGTEYESSRWRHYIRDWLEELTYEGQPLVQASNKPKPTSKRRYYSLADYQIEFDFSDEESGSEQLTSFKLPNGKIIAGKSGMFAHLLMRASADEPVLAQALIDNGIYTIEEIEGHRRPETVLSGMVSSLKSTLHDAEMGNLFQITRVDSGIPREGKGRRNEAGYYMERLDAAEVKKQADLKLAQRVTHFIAARNGLLKSRGLPTMPGAVLGKLDAMQETFVEPDEIIALQDTAFDALDGLVGVEAMEKLLSDSESRDDPRYDLADWAYRLLIDPKDRELLEQVLTAHPAEVLQNQHEPAEQQGGTPIFIDKVVFNVKGIGSVPVTIDENINLEALGLEAIEDGVHTATDSSEANGNGNGNGGERLKNRERRAQRAQEVKSAAIPKVGSALREMHHAGIDLQGTSKINQLINVFGSLNHETIEKILGRRVGRAAGGGASLVSAEEALYVHVVNDMNLTRKQDRDVLRAVIKEQLERYIRGLERAATSQ